MKLKRTQLVNIAIILLLALYFFTPIGFHAKVYLNRLISHNPVPVEERAQQILEDYDFKLVNSNGNTGESLRITREMLYLLISGLPGVHLALQKCLTYNCYMTRMGRRLHFYLLPGIKKKRCLTS